MRRHYADQKYEIEGKVFIHFRCYCVHDHYSDDRIGIFFREDGKFFNGIRAG
jgi:hypothetical protein